MKSLLLAIFLSVPMIQSTSDKTDLLGHFKPEKHVDFVKIDGRYTSKADIYMRKEAYTAFMNMHQLASESGIELKIISAARNFDYQKGIWQRKWQKPKYMGWSDLDKAKDIMTYSSMPGTSRHHWGTDIDLNSLENAYFESGKGKSEYEWLVRNAGTFGFVQTYTSKEQGRTGYNEEKWHWSYMPLAGKFLEQYKEEVSYDDITGFPGSDVARELKAIEDYVGGVSE